MAEPTADTGPAPPGPLEEALASVGDRWTLLVVAALLDGPRRFGDLQRALPGIAPNVLSAPAAPPRRAGARRRRSPTRSGPPRYVYELTSAGADLAGPLRLLADWGARHRDADPPRHEACGTPLEARWYCPTCERPVDDDQAAADEVHYA